ncbi:unnamed protein product, partial [Musa acuminata subsp. burmannicoides]
LPGEARSSEKEAEREELWRLGKGRRLCWEEGSCRGGSARGGEGGGERGREARGGEKRREGNSGREEEERKGEVQTRRQEGDRRTVGCLCTRRQRRESNVDLGLNPFSFHPYNDTRSQFTQFSTQLSPFSTSPDSSLVHSPVQDP